MRIPPKQYLVLKDAFLRQEMISGTLKREQAFKILGNESKAHKVYEFFVQSGWVNP